ncbi:MAG: hypothetical protein ACOYEW_16580, partial [Anaerolineae bacterium]
MLGPTRHGRQPVLTLVLGLVLILASLGGFSPASADDIGSAYITPDTMLARTWGSITLVYTVGEAGLAE